MKGLERLGILTKVLEKKLLQTQAAELLEISDRQVFNLLERLRKFGPNGLVSRKIGQPGNNKINVFWRAHVISLVKEKLEGWSPTLASEYLESEYKICVRSETLRRWMIEEGIPFRTRKRKRNLHPMRPRKGCFGMMIQIDGSHHDWFGNRGPKCVLMVMIDDATSRITALHFCKSEDLDAYYAVFEKHVLAFGIPLSIYGDRCGTLRRPKENIPKYSSYAHIVPHKIIPKHVSQFRSAMAELRCMVICAFSAQAKGRVERCNGILQDRLVKFLEFRKISSIEEANAIVGEYIDLHNKKFAKVPENPEDMHQALGNIILSTVLCERYLRAVSKDSVVQFNKMFYFISSSDVDIPHRARIEIRTLRDGRLLALYSGKHVQMTPLSEVNLPERTKPMKTDHNKKVYHPSKTHPWRKDWDNKKQKEDMLPSAKGLSVYR